MPPRPGQSDADQKAEALFVREAEELVAIAAGAGGFPTSEIDETRGEVIVRLQSALCRLHLAYLRLPEGRDVDHVPPSESHEDSAASVYEAWKAAGPRLADALAGVYRDLADGLELYRRGTEIDRQAALWAWHSLYWQHWGEELLKAQSAAYRRLARERFDRELS